jgi:hypothetical protein
LAFKGTESAFGITPHKIRRFYDGSGHITADIFIFILKKAIVTPARTPGDLRHTITLLVLPLSMHSYLCVGYFCSNGKSRRPNSTAPTSRTALGALVTAHLQQAKWCLAGRLMLASQTFPHKNVQKSPSKFYLVLETTDLELRLLTSY